MKKAYIITIIVSLYLLISLLFIPRHSDEEPKISQEHAERVAILQAEQDGYKEPTIWKLFNSESKLMSWYENKKITKYWSVKIDAIGNPPNKYTPAAEYMIDATTGTVLSSIRGLTQAGMDLRMHIIQLKIDSSQEKLVYEAKLINHGKNDYFIDWIEPFISPKAKESFPETPPSVHIDKVIAKETEMTISGEIPFSADQLDSTDDIIIGALIRVEEDGEFRTIMIDIGVLNNFVFDFLMFKRKPGFYLNVNVSTPPNPI